MLCFSVVVVLLRLFLPKGGIEFYRSSALALCGLRLSSFSSIGVGPFWHPPLIAHFYTAFVIAIINAYSTLYVGSQSVRLVFLNKVVFNRVLQPLVELDHK